MGIKSWLRSDHKLHDLYCWKASEIVCWAVFIVLTVCGLLRNLWFNTHTTCRVAGSRLCLRRYYPAALGPPVLMYQTRPALTEWEWNTMAEVPINVQKTVCCNHEQSLYTSFQIVKLTNKHKRKMSWGISESEESSEVTSSSRMFSNLSHIVLSWQKWTDGHQSPLPSS